MDPSHIASEIFAFVSNLSGPAAYITIFGILFICGLGIPIPEDITLLAAGLLAAAGQMTFSGALATGFLGVMSGDALLFFLGRRFGKRIFALPGLRQVLTPERARLAEEKIRRNGPFICFVARFLPGLRSPVFAMAGAMGVKRRTFLLLDSFAAMISVPVWVYLGHWFGSNFDQALEKAKEVQVFILTALAAVIIAYVVYKIWWRPRVRSQAMK